MIKNRKKAIQALAQIKKVEVDIKPVAKDTYNQKLDLAIAMGFKTLSDAFGHYGRDQFEKHFAESLNPNKAKK